MSGDDSDRVWLILAWAAFIIGVIVGRAIP